MIHRLLVDALILSLMAMGVVNLVPQCTPPAPPSPAPVPTVVLDASVDAGVDARPSGDVYDAACANLAAKGCAEGLRASCARAMRAADGQLTDFAPKCVAERPTVEAIRTCSPAWAKACPTSLGKDH